MSESIGGIEAQSVEWAKEVSRSTPSLSPEAEAGTPRTDSTRKEWKGQIRTEDEIWDFARGLERELSRLREQRGPVGLPDGVPKTAMFGIHGVNGKNFFGRGAQFHEHYSGCDAPEDYPEEGPNCIEVEIHPVGTRSQLREREAEVIRMLTLEEIESIRSFHAIGVMNGEENLSDKALKNIKIAQAIYREIKAAFYRKAALPPNTGVAG